MNNQELAKKILKEVGGETNIYSFTNCVTRLRFQIKDKKKVNQQALNDIEGVLGTQFQNDQFQVILGGKVVNVSNELNELVHLSSDEKEVSQEKKSVLSHVLNTLSSILTPALPPVIAGGLLKGFIFMFLSLGWVAGDSDSIIFFNALSDAMFYFFPFLLAVSSAKIFKTNEYLALTLAGLLMYPFAITDGQEIISLFGMIPVVVVNYSSSVLPIIFSVWLLKYVKNFFDKVISEMVNMIFSPLLSLLVVGPIAMALLAPLGFYIGEYLAMGVKWLIDFSPWLAGFIVGGTRPILVLGGMHHAMNPIMQQEISSFNSSQMIAMVLMSTFAQATAALVVYVKSKDMKEKQVALSAVIPGFLGITEPAIYGVLARYKGAMIAACAGGGIGAAVSTMLGGKGYAFVMPGIISIPAFMGEGFTGILIGIVTTISVTAILTFVLMNRFNEKAESESVKKDELNQVDLNIASPAIGEIVPLNQISDVTFSKQVLGKTVGISAQEETLYAPLDAVVKAVFPTNHAIGLELEGGIELLIHVGIDTVGLEGKGFEVKVKQGDSITKGTPILSFSKEIIKSEGLSDTIILVITNTENFSSVEAIVEEGSVDLEKDLFKIKK
ncbi:glucose PTS transporter subunit IIA [Vagococcus hydrophili]|uniref:PTS system sucrose-specific EIIBCA component n=1 Tax=Vagococcus hydrophili TaxID=2714947 RepID=A0A6G8AUB0_9ENTE|nr:glucose PTS transporter subunit IIA [Vagococcus hydrophili]QIL48532.1 PTS transporter subunit EIIC [Vagococcus hydrophili]